MNTESLQSLFTFFLIRFLNMKRASQEIRALVVKGVESGKCTPQQMAELTGYSLVSIYNWMRVYKEEKRMTPKPSGHRTPMFSESEQEQVRDLLKQKPGLTLVEIREHFHKSCSLTTVHNMLRKMGMNARKRH